MNYINEICQGCGKKLLDGDDVVVCPECGTPQHRECYNKEHKCVNEHLHSENFEWKPKHSDQPKTEETKSQSITCPFCGYENEDGAKMCANCGQPFEIFGKNIFIAPNENTDNKEDCEYKPPFDVGEFEPDDNAYHVNESDLDFDTPQGQMNIDPSVFGSDIPDGETCGVSNRDIKLYVRTSPSAYFKKFKSIERKKPTFNFGAFIFGHLWFFYRKLFKSGIIFMTLSLCLTFLFYNPLTSYVDEMSGVIQQVQQADEEIDMETVTEQSVQIYEKYMPAVLTFLGLNLALNLIMALTADRLYKKKAVRDITEINERTDGEDRRKIAEFVKKGGASFMTGLMGYFLQYLISSIVTGVFFQ